MSETDKDQPLRLVIAVDDPALSDRLILILRDVEGLQIVPSAAAADVVLADAYRPSADQPSDPLSIREHEVLALLAEGASNKVIARLLGISVHTAKFHVRSVMDKVDATGRTDAVAQALRQRLIEL